MASAVLLLADLTGTVATPEAPAAKAIPEARMVEMLSSRDKRWHSARLTGATCAPSNERILTLPRVSSSVPAHPVEWSTAPSPMRSANVRTTSGNVLMISVLTHFAFLSACDSGGSPKKRVGGLEPTLSVRECSPALQRARKRNRERLQKDEERQDGGEECLNLVEKVGHGFPYANGANDARTSNSLSNVAPSLELVFLTQYRQVPGAYPVSVLWTKYSQAPVAVVVIG
jgi:hypothetical protein